MTPRAWTILPLRAAVGLVFVMHGWQKLFVLEPAGVARFMEQLGVPMATLAAPAISTVELLGGLALLLGAWTRVAALLLGVDMLVALLLVHLRQGFYLPDGFEFVLTLLAACLTLAGSGAGPLSVDAARAGAACPEP